MGIKLFKKGHHSSYLLLATIFILVAFGLIMLASASSELGKIQFNDTYYYLKRQLLYGLSFGLIGFLAASKIYYKAYQKYVLFLLLISLVPLALVFTDFGLTAGGAGRWLKIGPLVFQPSEILKITFILYLAAWLSNPKAERQRNFFKGFLPFLVLTAVVAGLLLAQRSTSTVLVLVTAGVAVYFLSGAKWKYIVSFFFIGITALGLIVYTTPYRLKRVLSFLQPGEDVQDTGYHLNEALTTLGAGGLWGVGYGQAIVKTGQLPASISDSIFAVIGSELGFIGAGSIVVLFAFLTLQIFWLSRNCNDRFGQLILLGFGTLIGLQAFINMGAISGLIPLTGIPLPFISHGGTALAVFLTMSGIMVNISKYT